MGNCFANNKILSQENHESYNDQVKVDKKKTSSSSKFEPRPRKEECMKKKKKKKKKKVRFEIQNDEEVDRGSDGTNSRNVRRIRVVMSQEELKKMLSCKDEYENTTLEQLLGVMRLRGGKICKQDLGVDSWKPALESIPEDHLIK